MDPVYYNHTCTVCNSEYSDDEGGTEGYFGILPVSFCATCLSCMIDMASQFTGERVEDGDQS